MVLKEVAKQPCSTLFSSNRPGGLTIQTYIRRLNPLLSRKRLIINCREFHNTTSDSQLVSALAHQTGYWPIFTFLNSMGGLIDLASVGLIGQKGTNAHLFQLLCIS